MKNKIKLLVIIIQIYSFSLYAQVFEDSVFFTASDTIYLPYFGQNEILDSVFYYTNQYDSNLKSSIIGEYEDDITFHIPVKVWVLCNTDFTDQALSFADVDSWLIQVNDYFSNNNTNIEFYFKCQPEIVNSTLYNELNSDTEFDLLSVVFNESEAINFYMVYDAPNWAGSARWPWDDGFRAAVAFYGLLNNDNVNTSVHELGHTIGLLHTHEVIRRDDYYFNGDVGYDHPCYQESVSRTRTQTFNCISTYREVNCEINGDALTDTDASSSRQAGPFLQADGSCNWTGTGTDHWNDTWIPPITNIMSYVDPRDCRTDFTDGQIAAMQANIVLYFNENSVDWYNLHGLTLSGTVSNSEVESFVSPEYIIAPTDGSTYTLQSGSSVSLKAGKSIVFNSGFNIQLGSEFNVEIELTDNCSEVFSNNQSKKSTNGSNSNVSYFNDNQSLKECKDMLLRSLDKGNSSLTVLADYESYNHSENTPIVYPNPVSNTLNFELFQNSGYEIVIRIFSLNGIQIYHTQLEYDLRGKVYKEVDMSSLSEGVYFYRIMLNNQVFAGKIIK